MKEKKVKFDYYSKGGSLLIVFEDEDTEPITITDYPTVFIDFTKDGKLGMIEILFQNRDLISRLKYLDEVDDDAV